MKNKILLVFAVICLNTQAQTIFGIDVSSYEGTVNWTSVKAAGYMFAFAKASEGVGLTDSYFTANEINGTAAGVYIGAYHFAHPENNSAVAEANYFLSVAKPYIKTCYLPPVLDLEDPPSGPALATYFTSAQLTAWVQTWMTTVEDSTGIAPIIYIGPSNASYVNSSLNTWGLWIDDYNSNPSLPPTNMGVWTNWDFKQYSWTGTVPGVSGTNNCDMDVFHGDTNQFKTLIACNAVLAAFKSNTNSVCPGSTVNFTDESTTTGTFSGWKWQFPGGTPSTSTLQNPSVVYSTPGTYPVKEVVTSSVGKDSITQVSYINVVAAGSLPLAEGFQSAIFPPAGWYLNIPVVGDSVWELCTTNGYSSSQCMYFPANCGQTVNISGERQQLYTPDFNFAPVTKSELSFDVAYEPSQVPTYSDTLVVYYSTDCGATWTQIYSKGGMALCTTGSTTGAGTDTAGSHGDGCFVPPGTSAWRRDSVSLAAVCGQANVMFSFESRSGWGNIIYVDNINISSNVPTGLQNIALNEDVKVYPNPNKGQFSIEFSGNIVDKAQLKFFNLMGQEVYSGIINKGINAISLNVKPGMYFYRITTEAGNNFIAEGKVVIED